LVLLTGALLPARADEPPAPLHLFLQINLTSVLLFFPVKGVLPTPVVTQLIANPSYL
jgi:hypothetical protein